MSAVPPLLHMIGIMISYDMEWWWYDDDGHNHHHIWGGSLQFFPSLGMSAFPPLSNMMIWYHMIWYDDDMIWYDLVVIEVEEMQIQIYYIQRYFSPIWSGFIEEEEIQIQIQIHYIIGISHRSDLVVVEVEPSHEPHPSKRVWVKFCQVVLLQVKHSCNNTKCLSHMLFSL